MSIFVFILVLIVPYCTQVNPWCQFQLFLVQSHRSLCQHPPHSPIFIEIRWEIDKASREKTLYKRKGVSITVILQRTIDSAMFLRSIGSRFSIQKGALLLRRVPIRAATGAHQAVVEENGGDTSLVGHVYRPQTLRNITKSDVKCYRSKR